MDYKEKVEWLGRYQASVSCQLMLEEEIEVLRSDAERVTACMSGMPGRSGPNADRLPRAVERIEEAQKRLEQQLESCMETRAEIMCASHSGRTACPFPASGRTTAPQPPALPPFAFLQVFSFLLLQVSASKPALLAGASAARYSSGVPNGRCKSHAKPAILASCAASTL